MFGGFGQGSSPNSGPGTKPTFGSQISAPSSFQPTSPFLIPPSGVDVTTSFTVTPTSSFCVRPQSSGTIVTTISNPFTARFGNVFGQSELVTPPNPFGRELPSIDSDEDMSGHATSSELTPTLSTSSFAFGPPSIFGKPSQSFMKEASVFDKPPEISRPLLGRTDAFPHGEESSSFGKSAIFPINRPLMKPADSSGSQLAKSSELADSTFGNPFESGLSSYISSRSATDTSKSSTKSGVFAQAHDVRKSESAAATLFGKPIPLSEAMRKSDESKTSLFGKPVRDVRDSFFGNVETKRSDPELLAEASQSGTGLFGKGLKAEPVTTLFGKSVETKPHIVSPKRSLFGKAVSNISVGTKHAVGDLRVARSDDKASFSAPVLPSAGVERTLFGKRVPADVAPYSTDAPAGTTSDLFGKRHGVYVAPADTEQSEQQLIPTLSTSSFAFDSSDHLSRKSSSSKGLFGKAVTSLTTEAARRSVKKSIERQISRGSDHSAQRAEVAPRQARSLAYMSDDITKKLAIVVKNLPTKINNRDYLRRHFLRFGTVRRTFCNLKARQATLHFDDHDAAAKAMRHGAEGLAAGVKIYLSSYTAGEKKLSRSESADDSSSMHGKSASSSSPAEQERPTTSRDSDGATYRTAKEKNEFLDELEKKMRQKRGRETRLDKAVAIKGTCPDMCPERERYIRQEQRRLSVFEMLKTDDYSRGGTQYVDHARAVKEYSRSSADQDEPLPHELRPPAVLARTMDYLVCHVMDCGDDTNWSDWFDFLWNRTRAIRKDITQQHLCDRTAVDLLEKCARFHIYCGVRLCELSMAAFDQKINSENLTKCLQTLRELYQDLHVRHGTTCPNESEFRAYMVLMKLNDGDILREVQTYADDTRRSEAVRFALQAHYALGSNNYVRFFKLVRRATFLNACLMFRYFIQVRVAALLTIMKAFKTKGGLQYPVSDLLYQLAFEDEDDVIMFCNDHGLPEVDGVVLLERNRFLEPEGQASIRRPQIVIETMHDGLIGEIIQGGPLPDVTIPEATFSFDSEGRYLGRYGSLDAATTSTGTKPVPSPGTSGVSGTPGTSAVTISSAPVATSTPVILNRGAHAVDATPALEGSAVVRMAAAVSIPKQKALYSNEEVKSAAKDLFLEVIDEMVLDLSLNLIHMSKALEQVMFSYTDSLQQEQIKVMASDICHEVLSEQTLLKRQQLEEEERLRTEKLREEALCSSVVMEIADHVTTDVTAQMSQSVAVDTYNTVKDEEEKKRHDEITEAMCDDIIRENTDQLIAEFAHDIGEKLVKRRYEDQVNLALDRTRLFRCWKTWANRYTRQIRVKRSLENFPIFPNMAGETTVVATFLPSRKETGITDGAFFITQSARLTAENVTSLKRKRKVLNERMSTASRLLELRREIAWKPLDIVGILVALLEKESDALKTPIREKDLYWKLLVVVPDDEESELRNWLCAKLSRGFVTSPTCDDEGRILSLYSKSVPLRDGTEVRVYVCIRTIVQSALIDSDLSVLSGTAALLVLTPRDSTTQMKFDMTNDAMCDIQHTKGIPVGVVSNDAVDFLDGQEMMTSLVVGDDVEDVSASLKLFRGISWLIERRPAPPTLVRAPLRKYVEDFLSTEFFIPVYTDLTSRRRRGLLHQPPGVLLDLYQAAISHLAQVAASDGYVRYLWPAPEFVHNNSELPEYGWNSLAHLQFLRESLLSLSLADFSCSDLDSESWQEACYDTWLYISEIVAPDSDPTQLYSRVSWAIERARSDFADTCFLSERLVECEPLYVNMPWTDIVEALINHQLTQMNWTDPLTDQDEYPQELHVNYAPDLLAEFKPPSVWIQALKQTDEHIPQATAIARDTVARAAKRKLETNVAENCRSVKSYRIDTSICALDSAHVAHTSMLDLKSRLAAEQTANDAQLNYMERALRERGIWLTASPLLGAAESSFVSSKLSLPITSHLPVSERDVTDTSEAEIKACDTSCLPADLRSRVDEVLNQKSVDDSLQYLTRRIDEEQRATDYFTLRLKQMMNEPQLPLLERTNLNVMEHL